MSSHTSPCREFRMKALRFVWLLILMQTGFAEAADTPTDRWTEELSTDRIDGSQNFYTSLKAENTVGKGFQKLTHPFPWLRISCDPKGRTRIWVYAYIPIHEDVFGRADVRFRIEGYKPITKGAWGLSTDNEALVSVDANAINWAVAMTRSNTLTLEFKAQDGRIEIVEFSLFGLGNHLPKVAQACGWDYKKELSRIPDPDLQHTPR